MTPCRLSRLCLSAALVLVLAANGRALASDPLPAGTHPRVAVTAPTRLDWVFSLANQSPARPPAEWSRGYKSTEQSYQLIVPSGLPGKLPAGHALPLVLFISPGNGPSGAAQWKQTCQRNGILFASPHAAGNRCPFPQRVHIVLDVLDDIRRRYPIDPDRTYLAGFSGGGRVACTIGFALPEYFGGVISVCAAGDLRPESWLRRRVVDRLSVALITGETDFNRSEVERFRGPLLKEVGVRTRSWVQAGSGHAIPAGPNPAVFKWLEQDRPRRVALAKTWPASRTDPQAAIGRRAWARALLAEASKRLVTPATIYSGLMQLKGIRVRWNDLPEAEQAQRILQDYDSRPQRPWEQEDIAEQRRFLVARARSLDAYGSGPLPKQYAGGRANMLKAALGLWSRVLQDGRDKTAVKQARERIPILRKLLADTEPDPDGDPGEA
ncbi:MAG: hypothetical protein QF363_20100 [Planctomycetaceae bacterium]|nr:hypothetical protein [Planctomycetaceae bacterium]